MADDKPVIFVNHLITMPIRMDKFYTTCRQEVCRLQADEYGYLIKRVHQLVTGIQDVTCVVCLRYMGIAPAGPRLIDADGREVA